MSRDRPWEPDLQARVRTVLLAMLVLGCTGLLMYTVAGWVRECPVQVEIIVEQVGE